MELKSVSISLALRVYLMLLDVSMVYGKWVWCMGSGCGVREVGGAREVGVVYGKWVWYGGWECGVWRGGSVVWSVVERWVEWGWRVVERLEWGWGVVDVVECSVERSVVEWCDGGVEWWAVWWYIIEVRLNHGYTLLGLPVHLHPQQTLHMKQQ
jgi:hypothetical protein